MKNTIEKKKRTVGGWWLRMPTKIAIFFSHAGAHVHMHTVLIPLPSHTFT